MKSKLILATSATLVLAACGQQAEAPAPQMEPPAPSPQAVTAAVNVEDAWCRPTPNGARAGGCFVILTASTDDTLVGVATDNADMAQVHEMKMEADMMKMSHLENGLPLPAGVRVELKPRANHIMLMGLKAPLVEGESVKVTLDFANAPDTTVDFAIRTPPVVGGEQ